jgi:hypothetical protein
MPAGLERHVVLFRSSLALTLEFINQLPDNWRAKSSKPANITARTIAGYDALLMRIADNACVCADIC